jgi:hypothetical protein
MMIKKTGRDASWLGWSVSALLVMASGSAHAIPLPDSSSCTGGSPACLKIKNNSTTGTGFWGEAAGSGIGITGVSATGYGIIGQATGGGVGMLAMSGTANAMFATTGATASTSSGVSGNCSATSGGCVGVKGTVRAQTTGTAVFGDAGNSGTAWAGYFVGDISALNYFNNSDARLKKNVKDLSHATDSVLKLRPVTYQWKSDETVGRNEMGLIAQEVQKVFPDAVRADAQTGMLAVNYTAMVPVLIKSIQEQQETNKRLQAQIDALNQARVSTLQSSMMQPTTLFGGLALLPFACVQLFRRRKAA